MNISPSSASTHQIGPSGWRWPGVNKTGLLLLASLVLAGCTAPPPENYRSEFYALGTLIEVQIRAGSSDDSERNRAHAALRSVDQDFQRMHRDWHPWEAGAMADLNAGLVGGQWINTTPELIELIETSQKLESASDGLFNPAIGQLIDAWGFHSSDYPITEPPPSTTQISRLLATKPSTLALEIDDLRVRSANPNIRLDFSALAKGLAVRLACERLAEHGFSDALVNAGGDVMVCGPTDQPWRVAIRNPTGGVLQTLEIDQPLAIFTSGNYYRYGEWNGQRYAHILDPITGHPVDEVLQATVIHSDPLLADAGATTLVVAGSERWQASAKRMRLEQVIVVNADGQSSSKLD